MQQLESDLDVPGEAVERQPEAGGEREGSAQRRGRGRRSQQAHPDARGGSGEVRGEAPHRHPEARPGFYRCRRQPAHVQGAGEQELVR